MTRRRQSRNSDTERATGPALPAVVELAWGIRAPRRSGPKPALSVDEIVTQAVLLADDVGLARFSVNRLAAALNTAPMSLYRYFPSKADLLTLMFDAAYGPIPAEAPPPTPWRAGLEFSARSLFGVYRTHYWMLDISTRGLPMTPKPLAWIDYGLQCLDGTDLDDDDQLSALLLLDGHVRISARLAEDLEASGAGDPSAPSFSDAMRDLIRPERYPGLARVISSGAIEMIARSDTDPARFEFGLARVLDGIELYNREIGRGSDPAGSTY